MEASNKLIARHPIDNWELTINPEFGCWVFSDDEWELGVGNVITVNSALYPNHKDAVKEAKKIYKECETVSEAKSWLEILSEKYPNDSELGKEVRKIINNVVI